jgi:hypothetical protein
MEKTRRHDSYDVGPSVLSPGLMCKRAMVSACESRPLRVIRAADRLSAIEAMRSWPCRNKTRCAKKRLVHCSKSGPCTGTIDGGNAVNCGVLLNDFDATDLGARRKMSGLLVNLAHDAEVHHGAHGLDVCRLERAAKERGNLVAVALARSKVF